MVAPGNGRYQAREVRNPITVDRVIDPTIGGCHKCLPLQQHDGNAGRKQDHADHVEPASIPTSKTTTLTHIISDPIIRSFPVSPGGLKSHSGEPGLTDCGRLCDLMSPSGLAYLISGHWNRRRLQRLAQTG